MSKYQYLFWDLDKTILDFEKCEIYALKRTFRKHDIPFDDHILSVYMDINDYFWKMHDNGEIKQEDVLVDRFKMLFSEIGIVKSELQISEDYQESLTQAVFFENNALNTLRILQNSFDMYITSNGRSVTQNKRIDKANIRGLFKNIYISESLGVHKPDKEFFDKCLELSGIIERERVLIIGDSLTSDIKGGNNAQIDTCWYNPHRVSNLLDLKITYEISDLSQLVALLENEQ